MANPSVVEGILELPSGKVIEVGSTGWTKWLESESVKAFRFEGYAGTFTARKERPQKGSPYWSASRRIDGKLRKTYLAGSGEAITLSRLEEVAEYLASSQYATKSRKPATVNKIAYAAETPDATDTVSQLQKQVAELSMQLRLLQSDLPALIQSQVLQMQSVTAGDNRSGESDRLEESEAFRQELEAALGEVATLKAENHELKSQLATQQEKFVIYEDGEPVEISGGLASWALREADVKIESALDEVAELKKENEKLQSQLASQPVAPAPDYTAIADRALASLKLGKQAPGHKAAAKAIGKFIEFLQGQ